MYEKHFPFALTFGYAKPFWPSYTIDYKHTRSQKSRKAKRKKKKNNKAKNFAKLSKLKAKWESYISSSDYYKLNDIFYRLHKRKQYLLWKRALHSARNITNNPWLLMI